MKCPRCGNNKFREIDCGPDGWDDDITYTSEICTKCELWYDGWQNKWLIDCDGWRDAEDCDEFIEQEDI